MNYPQPQSRLAIGALQAHHSHSSSVQMGMPANALLLTDQSVSLSSTTPSRQLSMLCLVTIPVQRWYNDSSAGAAYLHQHACSSGKLPGLEPEEVDELNQVCDVLSSEVVPPKHLPPHAGLVLCMAQVVIQLHLYLPPIFVCSQNRKMICHSTPHAAVMLYLAMLE